MLVDRLRESRKFAASTSLKAMAEMELTLLGPFCGKSCLQSDILKSNIHHVSRPQSIESIEAAALTPACGTRTPEFTDAELELCFSWGSCGVGLGISLQV